MSAPVLADLNGNGTLEVLMPSDADTLYVWNSNGTSFNVYDSYGAFARMPSGSTFNFRGVSAAEIDANAGVEIVATTRDGHGYILDPISTQDYAPIRYSLPFPIQEWGSTPVIANLVSGSYKSIIYTTRNLGSGDGGVWVAWPYGQCVEALAYDSWVLAGLDKLFPQAPPIVADLDGGAPEIVVAGTIRAQDRLGQPWLGALVFKVPDESSCSCGSQCALDVTSLSAEIPVPS